MARASIPCTVPTMHKTLFHCVFLAFLTNAGHPFSHMICPLLPHPLPFSPLKHTQPTSHTHAVNITQHKSNTRSGASRTSRLAWLIPDSSFLRCDLPWTNPESEWLAQSKEQGAESNKCVMLCHATVNPPESSCCSCCCCCCCGCCRREEEDGAISYELPVCKQTHPINQFTGG